MVKKTDKKEVTPKENFDIFSQSLTLALDELKSAFKDDVKITLIIRNPLDIEKELIFSDDSYEGIREVLDRRLLSESTE
jgi:hypothetical protein